MGFFSSKGSKGFHSSALNELEVRAEELEVARGRISLQRWDADGFIICILPISWGLSQITVQLFRGKDVFLSQNLWQVKRAKAVYG